MSSARRPFRARKAPMSEHLLEIEGLHKRFGEVEVLKGVDCAMRKGDVISIIGSCGSGKTTHAALHQHARGLPGRARSASTARRSATRQIGRRRKRKPEKEIARQRSLTGMAFQQFNLFPHMTAARQRHARPHQGRRRCRKDEARRIADRLAGAGRTGRPRRQLSGSAFGRSAAARRHRPRHRHEPRASCCSTRSPRRSIPSW